MMEKSVHINAQPDDFAKVVLMPGDPLRAKYIAETFLEDVKLVTSVRNMLGYTGYYKGYKISVMGSGMGMPSMGIYAYELYKFFNVEKIIRIGTAGALSDTLQLYDVIIVDDSYSKSSFAKVQSGYLLDVISASPILTNKLEYEAKLLNIRYHRGRIYSSDVLFEDMDIDKLYRDKNCLAAEMEAFALFHTAKILKKEAACLLTVSNNLKTGADTSIEEREKAFNNMILLALETVKDND